MHPNPSLRWSYVKSMQASKFKRYRETQPSEMCREETIATGSSVPESAIGVFPPTPRASVELATLEWVSWFNHHRLLEPVGYIPPTEAEANYYQQLA
jgi:transposase InsO family protein